MVSDFIDRAPIACLFRDLVLQKSLFLRARVCMFEMR